ncbi:hypothetical protein DIPPA_28459 [Diplonema papillatum]|nr:hypothetical protein DIPPA_28459 [Diplonema papillatum]
MPHGQRGKALQELRADAASLEKACNQFQIALPSFAAEIQSLGAQSQQLDGQPAPPANPSAANLLDPTAAQRRRRFTFRRRD